MNSKALDITLVLEVVSERILQSPLDNEIRWREGQRFHNLFESMHDEVSGKLATRKTVLEFADEAISLAQLEEQANALANYLQSEGVKPGHCVPVLFDRSPEAYASILALSKVGAAFVPLDRSFPAERIKFIIGDCGAHIALSMSLYSDKFDSDSIRMIALDEVAAKIAQASTARPAMQSDLDDELAYIIYTSGTTGLPKGVRVNHSSICNFLMVAQECYGFRHEDRVYQSLTLAFDYSFEEIWVPLFSGATLVPAPAGVNLVGAELEEFLRSQRITAFCSVPTVLATIEGELPDIRLLFVSGEACPPDLAERWRVGRRLVNLYGPTETTVSCTWGEIADESAVTIGQPLPTYSVVILNEAGDKILPFGETGEIAIAGIGVTDGYLNREEETRRAFIRDFAGIPNNPGGKLYRSGDLGRIREDGKIEYHGRRDTQVKIRGYRIELTEIEEVAREVSGVSSLACNGYESESGTELVIWFAAEQGSLDFAAIHKNLSTRLPLYMVPSYFETIEQLPLQSSGKVDRKALPAPTQQRLTSTGKAFVQPKEGLEEDIAEQLAGVLKIEQVSADADFFADLAADSLLMANFLSKIRRNLKLKKASMRTIYGHTTVASLAAELAPTIAKEGKTGEKANPDSRQSTAVETKSDQPEKQASDTDDIASYFNQPPSATEHIATRWQYCLCAMIQVGYLLFTSFVVGFIAIGGWKWLSQATGVVDTLSRAFVYGIGVFITVTAFQIATKWLVVGKFTKTEIPLWSVAYARLWIAQMAIYANPMNAFIGTPFYSTMLRLLGAKIGKGTLLFSLPPVCTDLIDIGDNCLIRQDCMMTGFSVHKGWVRPGSIKIEDNSFVSEATVLDINTSMGSGSRLGLASCLQEGQRIPAGETWHGTPARKTEVDYIRVPEGGSRRVAARWYTTAQLLYGFATGAIGIAVMYYLVTALLASFTISLWLLPLYAVAAYFFVVMLGLFRVCVMPKIYRLFFVADQVHPLFGIQYWLGQRLTASSNSMFLQALFGDSSLIMPYYRAVGFDLRNATQNGSNFGVQQRQHSPFLCKFNRNTLVSDGLAMLNMDLSVNTFRMRQIEIAPDAYLGNNLHFPTNAKIGKDCLIATKALIPIEGRMREGVGILGSPPMEIPRSVARDARFDHYKKPGIFEQRLAMKLKSNLITLSLFVTRSMSTLLLLQLFSYVLYSAFEAQFATSSVFAAGVLAVSGFFTVFFLTFYNIATERLALVGKPMKPRICSLYEKPFWDHERYWKLNINPWFAVFNGTPLKSWVLRAQGVQTGAMVYDNGASISEPGMVAIGDRCCLNFGSTLQGHSLEDGTFKSDRITLGNRVTVGVMGFVHYGAVIHDDNIAEAHCFMMKGTETASTERWAGNPAQPIGSTITV